MNRRLFEIEIFCNIIKVFNATFYIINVSLGNNFFLKKKKILLLVRNVVLAKSQEHA